MKYQKVRNMSLLECKEDRNWSLPCLYQILYIVEQEDTIYKQKKTHEGDNADVGQQRDCRSCFNILNPLLSQPMQSLDQQQCSYHCQKWNWKVLAEDSNCQKNFHYFPPWLLVQPLNLCLSKWSKEDFLS